MKTRTLILLLIICWITPHHVFSQKKISLFGKIGVPVYEARSGKWDNTSYWNEADINWQKLNIGGGIEAIYHINKTFFIGMEAGYHTTSYEKYFYYLDYPRNHYYNISIKAGAQVGIKDRIFFRFSISPGYGFGRYVAVYWNERPLFNHDIKFNRFSFTPEVDILVKLHKALFLTVGTKYEIFLGEYNTPWRNPTFHFVSPQLGISYCFDIKKNK